MKTFKRSANKITWTVAIAFLLSTFAPFMAMVAHATAMSAVEVRFDRLQTSTQTTGTVCAKTATSGTESSVTVTYPTGYSLGAFGTFTVDTTTNTASWPNDPADGITSATAWPSIATPTGAGSIVGQAVTFPSGDLTAGTWYCFNWTNASAVETKATPTNDNSGTITTDVDTDGYTYSTSTVSGDQVTVSATVSPSFSFALANTSDNLGGLSTASVAASGTPATAQIDTNAKNGWQAWAKDSQTGLHSTNASKTIASTTPGTNSTLSAGTEGYNTGVTSSQVDGSGTITVATPFAGGTGQGGGLDGTLRTVATSDGTAQAAVLTMTNHAAISSLTPPATDYTDIITIVAAGLF